MANSLSQEKRNRQNEKRRMRNKAVRSELRTRERRALEAAAAGDATTASEQLRLAQQRIDRAALRRVLHPNAAARRKSRLQRRVDQLLESP